MTYIIGDIHEEIKKMDENSVDLIYTNPPFATTSKKWDTPLRWAELWKQMDRVLKPDGVVLLHCAIPFTYELISIRKPKYHYTWVKTSATNFFQAKKQPLRQVEEILVYYKSNHTYNPQMIGEEIMTRSRGHYAGDNTYYGKQKPVQSTQKGRYPTNFLGKFSRKIQSKSPKSISDDIMIRMISTYSNPSETVLDMTCCDDGLGTLCEGLNRNYIGVDISDEFLKNKI